MAARRLRAVNKVTVADRFTARSGKGNLCAERTFVCMRRSEGKSREATNMLSTILIIILILLLIGALPTWPYSSGWGYYPGGGLGLILLIVIILALMGRL